jgi:hypothetical protein
VTAPETGATDAACVVHTCDHPAEAGSSYCVIHGLRWGRGTPVYACHCRLTFPSHLARAAHAAGCPLTNGGDS